VATATAGSSRLKAFGMTLKEKVMAQSQRQRLAATATMCCVT
jgi:hypothetical protein